MVTGSLISQEHSAPPSFPVGTGHTISPSEMTGETIILPGLLYALLSYLYRVTVSLSRSHNERDKDIAAVLCPLCCP